MSTPFVVISLYIKKGITVISALSFIVLFCKKSVKIHFILNKTAFYLVVSKITTTFASDKENN